MQKKWLAAFWLLLLGLGFGVNAHQQDLLKTADISRIMDQIFSEHLGKNEISEKILHHALETYINQFDPRRIYLLESEVSPYFNATAPQLAVVMEEYKKGNFSSFRTLNQVIQTSIERSRRLREGLEEQDRNRLFHGNFNKQVPSPSKGGGVSSFAKTKDQLQGRIFDDLEEYIEEQKKRYGGAMTPQRKELILSSYEGEMREFENQYLYQNGKGASFSESEQENLFTLHVLKALASSLDSHTSFFEPSEAYEIRVRLQKEFKGIGLVLKDAQEGVIVTHLLDGGPAAQSGKIKVGDLLLKINGKEISSLPFDKTMEMLHGEKNAKVDLTFERKREKGEASEVFTVQLNREMIILKNDRVDVSSEAFGEGVIGVITLHSFYQGNGVSSEQDVRDAVIQLRKKGNLKGLILDLRENGGGFLSQAVKVAGLFITDGIIVISKYSNGNERVYRDVDGKTIYDGPLVVLTSKATASAAEIVAQALQDYGVALIVGDEHTYGKGTIQTQTVTDNQSSSYFKVTVGKYYTVSGHTPQKEGVKADIVAPSHWHREAIGERYADSLESDIIPPRYQDSLEDVPSNLRSWFIKYYIPKMQKRVSLWQDLLPTLRKNSEYRIANNKNYQYFLKGAAPVNDEEGDFEDDWNMSDKKNITYGEDDLQVQEAVDIVKDMVFLNNLTKKK